MECDKSELPELMSGLSVENQKQIYLLLQIAEDIYYTTPISFWESDEMNILFGENSQHYFRNVISREDKIAMHLRLEKY